MLIKQIIEVFDLLDSPHACGEEVKAYLQSKGEDDITVKTIRDGKYATDFIKIVIAGKNGRLTGGTAPTMGIVGRLGAIGARPEVTGYVSDGDGALCALAAASKLMEMKHRGDALEGDVIICTQSCRHAPTQPHEPDKPGPAGTEKNVPYAGCVRLFYLHLYSGQTSGYFFHWYLYGNHAGSTSGRLYSGRPGRENA